MKKNRQVLRRLVSFLLIMMLTAGMVAGTTGCGGKKDKSSEVDPHEQTVPISQLPLDCDVAYINLPGENAEIAQELTLSADGAPIDGSVEAGDVALKGSFKGMKVAKISNDSESVKLTITGSPSYDPEKAGIGNYGIVELAGKCFGEELPVVRNIPIVQLGDDTAVEGGYFYPFFDSAVEKGDAYELTITLCAHAADFVSGFSTDNITFDDDFQEAEVKSLTKKNNEADDAYTLVISVPSRDGADGNYNYIGKITLRENSLIDRNGKENAEEISAARSYSTESLGKDLSQQDLAAIQEMVDGYGESTAGTIIGTMSNINTINTTASLVLGWFGYSPESGRHAEIMAQLREINEKVTLLNAKMDEMNNVLQKQTDMLYSIEKGLKESALSDFNKSMTGMTSAISDIEHALSVKNKSKIDTLLDEYADIECADEDEMYDILDDIAIEIGDMRVNNMSSIRNKVVDLETSYREVISLLNGKSNPINRFVELCSLNDNFSTTSLKEKQAYALNIELNLKKALGILNFFMGFTSNTTNQDLYASAELPDVTAGVTKKGYPFCYLLNSYVRLHESENLWWDLAPGTDDSKTPYKSLTREDIRRFADRMHGRILWDELLLAGYREEDLGLTSWIGEYFGSYEPDRRHEGIGFIFVSSKKYHEFGNTLWQMNGFVRVEENKARFDAVFPDRFFAATSHVGNYKNKGVEADAIIYAAYGLMYNESSYVDSPVPMALKHHSDYEKCKQTDQWRYEVCYPMYRLEPL